MRKNIFSLFAKTSLFFLVFLLGGLFIQTAFAGVWSPPASAPPNGNPEPPLNTGATAQIKSGGLWAASLGLDGGAVIAGNVGIGTISAPTARLEVQGTAKFNSSVSVPAPINPTDAVNKAYVDAAAGTKVPKKQIFLTPGTYTWTPPAPNTWVAVTIVGGGGGGFTSNFLFSSGGSGYVAFYTGAVSSAQTITVGFAGNPGAYPGNAQNGGTSSFGTLTSASGGQAGSNSGGGDGYATGSYGQAGGLSASPAIGFMGIGSGGAPGSRGSSGVVIVEWLE